MTHGNRTFDCPWCGAISPVPTDHLGEHFACPECKQATKLTDKNTSDRPPTAPPPGAPHTSGLRTFDCPWCGAIAPIPASHLGERFHCPECQKETKLTPTNTRSAPVTAPPPDAPHVAAGGGGKVVLTLILLAAAGGGVWAMAERGGSSTSSESSGAAGTSPNETVAVPRADATPPPDTTALPTEGPGGTAPQAPDGTAPQAPDGTAPQAPGGTEPPVPATPPVPPAGPTPAEVERTRLAGEFAQLAAEAAAAEARLTQARQALERWQAEHPGAQAAVAEAAALDAIRGEVARRAPTATTPDAARAADRDVVTYLAAQPEREALAVRVFRWLATDLHGRETAGLAGWRDLHWVGPGASQALATLSTVAAAAAATPPADLVAAQAAALRTRDDLARRLAELEERVNAGAKSK